MRRTCLSLWILCLSGYLAAGQSNVSAFKLTGIVSLPDFKRALLESPAPPRGEGLFELGEGARKGRFELLTINQREGWVEVLDGGEKATLKLHDTATKVRENDGSNLRLSNANLQQVLDVYATISERTVLQHPALKATTVSLKASAKNRTEAADALEKSFQEHGMVSIPDGTKFMLIIPSQLTNTVTARSSGIVPKTSENATLASGTIRFENADLSQALAVYGHLVGRKLAKADGLRATMIRLRTVNDLTPAEAAYALEILFRWNGVAVVPIGETEFQAVPILPGRRQ
jgi:hypothetical protein